MAGLIPQPFIDELLDRVDIGEVIDSRVPLKRSGKNLKGLCPFHKEKTPSFTVNGDEQFYYCFGCGAGGNAIGFIMSFDQVDFPEAVETLARDNGMEVPREENKAAARKQADDQRLAEQRQQNCRNARNQLMALDSGQRMARINDKGEREVMDDQMRAESTRQVREVIASECR